MTTSVTQTRRTQAPHATAAAASNPNAILSKYKPTGASEVTAHQDGLHAGVAASHKMAETDRARLQKYAPEFAAAGKKYGLPPALLAAIASRESRGGAALDSRGFGDHGNGYGLMQVDKRYHKLEGGPHSTAHIEQAAGILKADLNAVKKAHPSWPPEQQLRGAVAAYNSGAGNVQTIKNMDVGTTGNDYSNDVWARAQDLAPHFGGATGTSGSSGSSGTGGTKPSTGTSHASAPTLKEGSSGAAVKTLQNQLNKLGFSVGKADGEFGPKTEHAVKSFQSKHHLTADGVAGPKTHAALQKALEQHSKPAPKPTTGGDHFEPGSKYKPAPALADVKSGKAHLHEGMEGGSVKHVQKLLGIDTDGQFGPATKKAVSEFQHQHHVGTDSAGSVGPKTLAAMEKAAKAGTVVGNYRIDTNNPILHKLATSHLNNGPTGYCVLTTLNNMKRLGVPHTPVATGSDPNNPRGGMAQMLRNGGWASVPFPGSHKEAIHSPYGNATANVVSASQYRKLASEGKVPSGAIIFQSRTGWGWSGGSHGNDMGIVRNHGNTTHNYADMPGIVYGDCKSVVIMVPKDALKPA
ncbi:MAG: peptidoglycan-binding protein [Hyalangium sp.]|uniref:peptidoglycan-binding protein n=1 Tax=Hyalangium sp. TaxID=2028555 RepID=UPI003899AE3C